jgi:hypothetical protein
MTDLDHRRLVVVILSLYFSKQRQYFVWSATKKLYETDSKAVLLNSVGVHTGTWCFRKGGNLVARQWGIY